MAQCNILSFTIMTQYYRKNWEDLCCWLPPAQTYDGFVTGLTETYNDSCLKDRVFSDYVTRLFNECLTGSSSDGIYVTGGTANGTNDTLVFTNNSGGTFTVANSALLFNDAYVSGGTLDTGTGCVTFVNTSGGTFQVCGFDGFKSYWSANTFGIVNSGLTGNVGIGTTTPNKPLTVAGDISGTTDLYIDDNIRGLRGQFGDSPVPAGPIRDLEVRNDGSTYLRLESLGNSNQVIEFMNSQEPDFSIYNKYSDGGLIIASDDKQFIIIGADDGNTIDLNAHTTISGNTNITGDTAIGGILGITGKTYLGTLAAAGASYTNNEILVRQDDASVEYLTIAQLKEDIADADLWSANTFGIVNSGLTAHVGIGTATPNKPLTVVGDISGTTALYLGRSDIFISGETQTDGDLSLHCDDDIELYSGDDIVLNTNCRVKFTYLNHDIPGIEFELEDSPGNCWIQNGQENTVIAVTSANTNLYFYDIHREYIGGDGTDLTIASGADIKLTATSPGYVEIPVDVPLSLDGTVHDDTITSDGTNLTIAAGGGDIILDAATDIVLDAAGGNIEFKDAGTLALTIDIDSTAGDAIFKDAGSTEIFRIDGSEDSLLMDTSIKIQFRDTGLYIQSSTDGQLDIVADTALVLTSPYVGVGNAATGPGAIRFYEDTDDGAHYAALTTGALAASYTLTLPTDDGDSGEVLSTDGSGALSWIEAGGGGTSYWTANTYGIANSGLTTTKVGIGTATPKTKLDVHHNPTNLVNNTGGGEVVTLGTEHGTDTLAAGKLMYLNTSGVWRYADADVSKGNDELLAIALGTTVAEGLLIRGFFDQVAELSDTFVKGGVCYVGTPAAQIQFTQPSGTGDFVRVVGYGTSTANVIYFNPDGTYITVA